MSKPHYQIIGEEICGMSKPHYQIIGEEICCMRMSFRSNAVSMGSAIRIDMIDTIEGW